MAKSLIDFFSMDRRLAITEPEIDQAKQELKDSQVQKAIEQADDYLGDRKSNFSYEIATQEHISPLQNPEKETFDVSVRVKLGVVED